MTLRYIGELATFSIVVAVAKASIEQPDTESLKILKIWKGLGSKLIQNSAYSFNIPHQLIFQHGSNSFEVYPDTPRKNLLLNMWQSLVPETNMRKLQRLSLIYLVIFSLCNWLIGVKQIEAYSRSNWLMGVKQIEAYSRSNWLMGVKQIEAYSRSNWLMG